MLLHQVIFVSFFSLLFTPTPSLTRWYGQQIHYVLTECTLGPIFINGVSYTTAVKILDTCPLDHCKKVVYYINDVEKFSKQLDPEYWNLIYQPDQDPFVRNTDIYCKAQDPSGLYGLFFNIVHIRKAGGSYAELVQNNQILYREFLTPPAVEKNCPLKF